MITKLIISNSYNRYPAKALSISYLMKPTTQAPARLCFHWSYQRGVCLHRNARNRKDKEKFYFRHRRSTTSSNSTRATVHQRKVFRTPRIYQPASELGLIGLELKGVNYDVLEWTGQDGVRRRPRWQRSPSSFIDNPLVDGQPEPHKR